MSINELEIKVSDNRDRLYEEIEDIIYNGYDYRYEEQMYDEGYMNALNWVLKVIKEV